MRVFGGEGGKSEGGKWGADEIERGMEVIRSAWIVDQVSFLLGQPK